MTQRLLPEFRLDYAFAALAALLSALAAWPWLPQSTVLRAPTASPEVAAPSHALDLPPLADFAAVVDRPLFTPSRRPSASDKRALGAGLGGRYRLLGLVTAGERRRALLADGSRVVEMKEGDTVEGWRIKRIEQDRLVLSSGAGEAVLTLRQAPAAALISKRGR
jgi:hypothetical protein